MSDCLCVSDRGWLDHHAEMAADAARQLRTAADMIDTCPTGRERITAMVVVAILRTMVDRDAAVALERVLPTLRLEAAQRDRRMSS